MQVEPALLVYSLSFMSGCLREELAQPSVSLIPLWAHCGRGRKVLDFSSLQAFAWLILIHCRSRNDVLLSNGTLLFFYACNE